MVDGRTGAKDSPYPSLRFAVIFEGYTAVLHAPKCLSDPLVLGTCTYWSATDLFLVFSGLRTSFSAIPPGIPDGVYSIHFSSVYQESNLWTTDKYFVELHFQLIQVSQIYSKISRMFSFHSLDLSARPNSLFKRPIRASDTSRLNPSFNFDRSYLLQIRDSIILAERTDR
jgi:hypothetical protein